jgi:hypothetical protein
MTYSLLSAVVLVVLVSDCAIAGGEISRSDGTRPANFPGGSGMATMRGSSWEGWLDHGVRKVASEPAVSQRNSDSGASIAPLAPSVGPESGLPGPEAGRSPSRFRLNRETEYWGAGIDGQRR